jgi:hypothetical protein
MAGVSVSETKETQLAFPMERKDAKILMFEAMKRIGNVSSSHANFINRWKYKIGVMKDLYRITAPQFEGCDLEIYFKSELAFDSGLEHIKFSTPLELYRLMKNWIEEKLPRNEEVEDPLFYNE